MKKKKYDINFIGEKQIAIEEGESILDASLKSGIPHYHSCGGNARCTTCRILVQEGLENLNEINEKEAALRKLIPFSRNARLACQTYVTGPVSLHRMIKDDSDLSLYLDEEEGEYDETGEERPLVLLFLDIRNFTPFIESYLAFDVIHILRKLFRIFRNCIQQYNGNIIETAGDGLYAVFGFKTDMIKASKEATAAGFAMLEGIQLFNKEYVEKYFRHHFEIGIGIHCGKVIVGNVGLGINNNLTVMGLPVNIASRIQAATKVLNNNFIVSEDVFSRLQYADEVPSSHIRLKGIKEPVKIHLLGTAYLPAGS
jgi:adenylate cyclase